MNLSGKHLIDGHWVAAGGQTFSATNPVTGESLPGLFHQATDKEVEQAMGAARTAFAEARRLSHESRALLLETMADKIVSLGRELLDRGHAETALPIESRLAGERTRTVHQLRLFAALVREGSWVEAVIDTADPSRRPVPKPDLRRLLMPIGPVVVFDPSNFPFAFGVCGGDTASALASGNPVIVKGHSSHPGTNELFARAALAALEELDLPRGLIGLVHGPGRVTGSALVRHPACRAVGFTGSLAAGRALFDLAAARPEPIPVYAEMGSLNPLVVLPGAIQRNGPAIASDLADSITLCGGQFCTKPGLVLVLDGESSEPFIGDLAACLAAKPRSTLLDASVHQGFADAMQKYAAAGGRVRLDARPSPYAVAGAGLIETDSRTWRRQAALREEAFGPSSVVVRCLDVGDLIETIGIVGGSLTGSLHYAAGLDELAQVERIACALAAIGGRVIFNGYPTGLEVGYATVHSGPYPAMTFPSHTSVGTAAIRRFVRPACFQNAPDSLMPAALQNANPLGIWRLLNGQFTREPITPA